MTAAEDATVLTLSGLGISPYSARGLTQTLAPIDQAANVQRTINGRAIDLSASSFFKYASEITGSDQRPPSCDGLWPGRQVVVGCIAELGYPEGGSPLRPVVAGSSYTEAGWVFYRPTLTMMVLAFSLSHDEWARTIGWSMSLEEI